MLKINLLSENEMAQKSKSEKYGNVDFLTEKNGEKLQTFQTPKPQWCSVKTNYRFRFVYHLKRRQLPSKASVIHVC